MELQYRIMALSKRDFSEYTKFTFFYKTRHPFSNWHPAMFVDASSIVYNCSEQYMMAEKAKLFNDREIRNKILESTDPREQKELGRQIRGFDSKIWSENARRIMYEGLLLKFSQNAKLREILSATAGTLIVEAAKDDKIWGIGLGEDDPLIHDRKNWLGTNWLGETLTELREDFLRAEKRI